MNNFNLIREIMYNLKREYGTQVIFATPNISEYDLETGDITRTYLEYTIKRVVILPKQLYRTFAYEAPKSFQYGGLFDVTSTVALIDGKDLGAYKPSEKDHAIIDGRRYEVGKVIEEDGAKAYLVELKELKSTEDET